MIRRRAALPAALLVLALVGAACGSSPSESADGIATAGGASSKKASATQGSTDPQQAALDFAECMREHGVDMPDPEFSGDGVRIQISREGGLDPMSDTFKQAQEACGSLFGGPGGPGGAGAGGSSAAVRIGGGRS